MDFHDFPKFLGKSGVHHREVPKLCAGLEKTPGGAPVPPTELPVRHPVKRPKTPLTGWQVSGQQSEQRVGDKVGH